MSSLSAFEFGFDLSVLRHGEELSHIRSELRRLNRLCGHGSNLLVNMAAIEA